MLPRATSTDVAGEPDGFAPEPAWSGEIDPRGGTRIVVSVPAAQLPVVHQRLVAACTPPLGVLWRQVVDRRAPRANGAPPKDHVALDVPFERLLAALRANAGVVYEDARAELWIRGRLNEQVVLDQDGLVYTYPDDPAFRDALDALGIPDRDVPTLARRDYVKHWFHAEHDAQEAAFVAALRLTPVPTRR
jgi:hypothetical protein